MGYSIERGKRVVSIPTDDKRFSSYLGDFCLYLTAAASNNVHPRTYAWEAIASANHSVWAGEVQLPSRIWSMASAADGGSIKPWGKDTSGVSYVKAWKRAAAERRPAIGADGGLLWAPAVYTYISRDAALAKVSREGPAAFCIGEEGDHWNRVRAELFAAAGRVGLLENVDLPGIDYSRRPTDVATLLDAVHLWVNREYLPFGLYLSDREDSTFLADPSATPALL